MPQLGEPPEWENSWEGTESEELIQKTDENRERLDKLESTMEGIKYDFEALKADTIRIVSTIYKNLSEM
jgi:hypothetical protein